MNRLGFDYNRDAFLARIGTLALKHDRARALFFSEKLRADFVFDTAALEGNPFTFPEVKTLIEGVTVGGRNQSDAEQVSNINDALSWVIDRVRADALVLDRESLCRINEIVARNASLEWGAFRTGGVTIAGTAYLPPRATDLPSIFSMGAAHILSLSEPIERACVLFLFGSLRQFFYDGNRRSARMLASGLLLMDGLPVLQIRATSQRMYNEVMTRFYDTQQADEALQWLLAIYSKQLQESGFVNEAG